MERARDLLEAMKEFRFEKKHWQCVVSILIKTYAKVGQLWEPIKLFEEMHAVGYPVNNRIHTTMLNVYFKVGRHRCAEALFLDMIETGKCRNMVAFGTMINIYGRMGRCRAYFHFLEGFRPQGKHCYIQHANLLPWKEWKFNCCGGVCEVNEGLSAGAGKSHIQQLDEGLQQVR